MNDPKKNISFDEALQELSDIARHGEGNQKLRALIEVMSREKGSVTIPEPLGDEEKLELAAMMLRSLGQVGAEFAYRRAFPRARDPVQHVVPKFEINDLNFDESALPETLLQFYRMFPEVKPKGGFPAGFPKGKSVERKKQWVQREAKRILTERKEAELAAVVAADKAAEVNGEG